MARLSTLADKGDVKRDHFGDVPSNGIVAADDADDFLNDYWQSGKIVDEFIYAGDKFLFVGFKSDFLFRLFFLLDIFHDFGLVLDERFDEFPGLRG